MLARDFQLTGSISRHFLWIQVSHVSHWMAGWEILQGREHTPQGYFVVGGPGLVSMSPDSIRRLRIQAEWEVEWFRFRAELFLMLLGSEWNGCGEVRARLTCGRGKCSLALFWLDNNLDQEMTEITELRRLLFHSHKS